MPPIRSKGILLMLTAVAVFAVMDASMKRLTLAYPPSQVSCLRGAASIPVMLAIVGWLGAFQIAGIAFASPAISG